MAIARARTQAGAATCADTASVLPAAIQAAP